MEAATLHRNLAEIAPRVLSAPTAGDAELDEAEAHAAEGCSLCARALVDARDVGVVLASAEPAREPPAALRDRILARARGGALRTPGPGAEKPRRLFDPSGEVARLHIGAPGDAERVAEIDALSALEPLAGDACGRLLAQIEHVIGFPLMFVSIVRGPRVGYRVQRGFDASFGEGRDRRRETSFCTHTVSGDTPLVVHNAAEEPFFRGSTMVQRAKVHAYVGVPLRTSRGIVIGTLCAMDFRPRAVGPEVIRALQLFTEPVLAEVERSRRMPPERLQKTPSGAPIHRAPWFRDLLEVEFAFASGSTMGASAPNPRGRGSVLITASGRAAEGLADVAHEHEPVGWLGEGVAALLLPGADPRGAENRAAEIEGDLASRGLPTALGRVLASGQPGASAWWASASASVIPR
jgi:GAF domain-containing protein